MVGSVEAILFDDESFLLSFRQQRNWTHVKGTLDVMDGQFFLNQIFGC